MSPSGDLIRYSRVFLLSCALLLTDRSFAVAQWLEAEEHVLPRFETTTERLLRSIYVPPPAVAAVPPPGPVRAMAEYEELEGIVVRWAYNTQNLLLSEIVDAAQEEGKVWIIVRPGTADSNNIKSYLAGRNIPLTNLEFLSISTNSIWCRDYGPWTVYDVDTDSMAIVDFRYNRPRPQDDQVPVALALQWGLPLYQTLQSPDSLVHTGGNFMVDGFATGFSSELIYQENPHVTPAGIDSTMNTYCGLDRYVTMSPLPYDVIHHIDMHMKLLDDETLLVGQYPVNRADYNVIENTVAYLRTLTSFYGRPYRIVRILMPPDTQGRYPDNGSDYLTYTNSVIVNKTVLVPIYGLPSDANALQVYRDAMPGYNIVGFNSISIIPQLGAIHCITKEVGVREPVRIVHRRIQDIADSLSDILVEATVKARSGIDSVRLLWRTDSTAVFESASMSQSGDVFSGWIPQQPFGTTVWYYLEAHTGSGRAVARPLPGADGPYMFRVEDSTTTSVRSADSPISFNLYQNFPNPFNSSTIVEYALPVSGSVSLKVYDLLGQEAATLHQGDQQPGRFTALWEASSLSSGTYLIRLLVTTRSGEVYQTIKRAVLLK